jgi:hypothetical protein
LLNNVDFVIKGTKFTMDISSFKVGIEEKFRADKSRITPTAINETFYDVLTYVKGHVDEHIISLFNMTGPSQRVESFEKRRLFFNKLYNKTESPVKITSSKTYWEKTIVPLAINAPTRYVHIETCVPYTESYSIRNIDKALLIWYMIGYLLSKHAKPDGINYPKPKAHNVDPMKMKESLALRNLFYTQYDINKLSRYPRYPVLNKFVELLPDGKKSLAFEYMHICDILRNVETPFQVDVFKELSSKAANKLFPNTTIAIDSTVGRILTRSYPYRLDMPSFIYEDMDKNMETFITKAKVEAVAGQEDARVDEQVPKDQEDARVDEQVPKDQEDARVDEQVSKDQEDAKVDEQGAKAEQNSKPVQNRKRTQQLPGMESSKKSKTDEDTTKVGGVNSEGLPNEPQNPGKESEENSKEQSKKAAEGLPNEPQDPEKEPEESSKEQSKKAAEGLPQTPKGSTLGQPIFNQHVVTFIKDEILQKMGTANYFSSIKEVLIDIMKINDPTYTVDDEVKKDGVTEESKPDEIPSEPVKDIISIIKILNATHDVFKEANTKLIEDVLDPYEFFFNEKNKKTSATQPEPTTTPDPPAAKKEQPEQQIPVATKPDDPAATTQDQTAPKASEKDPEQPEPVVAKTPTTESKDPLVPKPDPPTTESKEPPAQKPAGGGGQKKHKFEGRLYNVHEHRGVKYIITKSYGIVPVYS